MSIEPDRVRSILSPVGATHAAPNGAHLIRWNCLYKHSAPNGAPNSSYRNAGQEPDKSMRRGFSDEHG